MKDRNMQKETFRIQEGQEFIELIKLLKVMQLASSGGEAKAIVDDGLVKVNGKTESRKRAKLRAGDEVQCFDQVIVIES